MTKLDSLPAQYTVAHVIGVTKGRERWSVYFNDGAHFTQCHGDIDNLGLEAPCRHLYFGNVSNTIIDYYWDKAVKRSQRFRTDPNLELYQHLEDYAPIKAVLDRGVVVTPSAPAKVAEKTHSLFEVMLDSDGDRSWHLSGGWLEPASLQQKSELLNGIRNLTTKKLRDGQTGNWFYASKEEVRRHKL